MSEQKLWQFLIDAIERQGDAALLLVVASKGSSPGTAGAKMALTLDGEALGTIGGGQVEFDLARQARRLLPERAARPIQLYERHHKEQCIDSSGHICGGHQQVVLWLCQRADLPVLRTLYDRAAARKPVVLTVTERGVQTEAWTRQSSRFFSGYREGEHWCYREVVGLSKQAYIVGGGHVSLALSRLLSQLDYGVTVLDQREDVVTMQINDYADNKVVMPYSRIDQAIPEGMQSYVFVMTHSHEIDQLVMGLLAGKEYRYLGLMGSRRKIDIIKRNLSAKVDEEIWKDIHAPLGLSIKSKTPMEIAVSIVAELIQLNNAGYG